MVADKPEQNSSMFRGRARSRLLLQSSNGTDIKGAYGRAQYADCNMDGSNGRLSYTSGFD